MGVLYLYVALKAGAGVFDVSSFALFLGGASMLASGVGGIGSVTMLLGTSAVQIGTFKQIVETPQRIAKGTLPVEKRDDNRYDIAFQNVSFRYPGSDTEVLHKISVRLRIGSHVAVVGENGSGKTTFIKLLCRLYDVSEGSITLNDIDIKKYDPREYRSLFSVVFQDYQLFAVPLAQNVASSLAIEDAKLWDCLEKAGIAERVRRLPQKEQTALLVIMERDEVSPSLGQAKRLKELSEEGKLDANVMDVLLREDKALARKVTLKNDRLQKYFPPSYTPKQMEEVIIRLLDQWQRKKMREQER